MCDAILVIWCLNLWLIQNLAKSLLDLKCFELLRDRIVNPYREDMLYKKIECSIYTIYGVEFC